MQIVTITVGVIGFISLSKVVTDYSKVSQISFPNTVAVLEMQGMTRYSRALAMDIALPGSDVVDNDKAIDKYNETWKEIEKAEAEYLAQPFLPGEEVIYNEFAKKRNEQRETLDYIISLYKKNPAEDSAERKEMDKLFHTKLKKSAAEFQEATDKLKSFHSEYAKNVISDADSAAAFGKNLSIAIIALGVLLGMSVSYIVARNISNRLTQISNSLGDSSSQVSQASTQIAGSSQELSQASTEQAASLEQTAASIEEISSMVAKSSENSKKSAEEAFASKEKAEDGQNAVRDMINSISEISRSNDDIVTQIDKSNTELESIVKVIEEIGSKTKVINEIVFQTKLLSFNASVEAARAGEQGKGFAVVAEEVGNLAQMSGKAAKEISDLLENSTSLVKTIITQSKNSIGQIVEEGKAKIASGNQVAERCSEILESIVTSVSNVTEMSKEISVAAEEQTRGIQEITKAMSQLDQTTQTNSATSQEAASAAEQLSSQSQSLKDLVSQLRIIVNGGQGDVEAPIVHGDSSAKSLKNVIPFKKAKPSQHQAPAHSSAKSTNSKTFAMKKTVNADSVPSYDDPGFGE